MMFQSPKVIDEAIFASCDSKYFIEYAPSFLKSAIDNTNKLVHIHLINPTEEASTLGDKLEKENPGRFTYYYEQKNLSGIDSRTYYACNRFIIAPWYLNYINKLLILDIDSIIRDNIDFPKEDWGLMVREPLPGMNGLTNVAAGIVYYTKNSLDIATEISDFLLRNKLQWFIDQFVLWETYKVHKDKKSCCLFEKDMLDWEFNQDSKIWSGKGNRKFEDKKYLEEVKKYLTNSEKQYK